MEITQLRLNLLECSKGMGLTVSRVGGQLYSIGGYTCFQLHCVFNPCAGGKTLLLYL